MKRRFYGTVAVLLHITFVSRDVVRAHQLPRVVDAIRRSPPSVSSDILLIYLLLSLPRLPPPPSAFCGGEEQNEIERQEWPAMHMAEVRAFMSPPAATKDAMTPSPTPPFLPSLIHTGAFTRA